jgi:hypothetical protein
MPRAKKLSASQLHAAQNEGKKALETATKVKPERYYELRAAWREAFEVYHKLDSQLRALFQAQSSAWTLEEALREADLGNDASIVAGLSARVQEYFKQVRQPLNEAIIEADKKHKEAMAACYREFPNG